MSLRAGLVITGTEVLCGRVQDRNGPWLADRLAELGVDLAHLIITGDRPRDLRAALEFLRGEATDLMITSGGLGPTADDLTAEVVAEFAGRPLLLDERLERRIGEIIAGFARRLRIDEVVAAFPLVEKQRGMFFVVGGRVLGLDVVSRDAVYADLHEKLVRSYAIDLAAYAADSKGDAEKLAYEFMDGVTKAEFSRHPAVGIGTDVRFSSDDVFGAALTVEEEVVHLTAFGSDGRESSRRPDARMASYRARRRSLKG